MTIKELAQYWEKQAKAVMSDEAYNIRLPIADAAKIEALAEMYPKRNKNEIIGELISSALEELEKSFPYIEGKEVSSVDEMGDPMYKDVGPTPAFLDLSKKHKTLLKQSGNAAANG